MASQIIKTLRVLKGEAPAHSPRGETSACSPRGQNQLQKTIKSLKGEK